LRDIEHHVRPFSLGGAAGDFSVNSSDLGKFNIDLATSTSG